MREVSIASSPDPTNCKESASIGTEGCAAKARNLPEIKHCQIVLAIVKKIFTHHSLVTMIHYDLLLCLSMLKVCQGLFGPKMRQNASFCSLKVSRPVKL